MERRMWFSKSVRVAGLLALVWAIANGKLLGQSEVWVGTWAAANYAVGESNLPASPFLANNSFRQVVRVSIGGHTLRLRLSNKTSATPVVIRSVHVAISTGGSSVDPATLTPLTFQGHAAVNMEAHGMVVSDPVRFALSPGQHLAITLHYGEVENHAQLTGHVGSRTDSYLLAGNQAKAAEFNGAVVVPRWYHIHSLDVLAPSTAGSVAILGNSITDGYGLSGGLQNRWPDMFSQQLLSDPRTRKVGVLNLGIGGTLVTTSGLARYQEDLLGQSGLRWIIVFYGVNDIGADLPASAITEAYQQIIREARAAGVKIYGATITPFQGHSYYTPAREAVRNEVNTWIRTFGNFDACIDFDLAIRDPQNPLRLMPAFSNDGLHPSVAGYEWLGKSVNPALFMEPGKKRVQGKKRK